MRERRCSPSSKSDDSLSRRNPSIQAPRPPQPAPGRQPTAVPFKGENSVSFAVPALAQAEKGDKEVLFNGDVTTAFGGDTTSSTTTGNVSGGLGYYFTQQVELFGALNLGFSRDAIGGTNTDAGVGLAFRYNFARTDGRPSRTSASNTR